ncbi:MAG: adenylate/guanylate cyclase domain-containing protein, partial [Candidatus Riflebacteria bacterium]
MPKYRFWVIATSYLLFMFLTAGFFSGQQNQLNELRVKNTEKLAYRFLPIVQEQMRPANLAESLLRRRLQKFNKVTRAEADLLQKDFQKAFGEQFSMVVLGSERQKLVACGLSSADHDDFSQFLKDQYSYHFFSKPKPKKHSLEFFSESFDQTVTFEFLPNFINVSSCRFHGREGLVMIATLVDRGISRSIRKQFAMTVPTEALEKGYIGSIMAFFPIQSYANLNFVSRQSDAEIGPDHYLRIIGSSEEIFAKLKQTVSTRVADKFLTLSASRHQGVFSDEGKTLGFSRIGLDSFLSGNAELFAVFLINSGCRSLLREHFPVILLFILNMGSFFYLLFRLEFTAKSWNWKLIHKFLAMALMACLLPIAGLVYQNSLQQALFQEEADREVFAELESTLASIENGHQILKNDLAIDLQVLNEKISGEDTINYAYLRKEANRLSYNSLIQVYAAKSDNTIDSINAKENWDSDDTRTGTMFVKSLIRFILKNLKIDLKKSNSEEDGIDKEAMLIESAAEAMGVDALYQLALYRNRFIPFKLIHGSIWAFIDLQNNDQKKFRRMMMHVVNRNSFTLDYLEKIQLNQSQREPQVFLLNRSLMQIEKMAPTLLETSPDHVTVLKTVNAAGGAVKIALKNDQRRILIFARQLHEMNCSGMAVKVETVSLWHSSNLVLVSLLAYLAIMLIFFAMWFNGFFMQPLQQLKLSANSIAAGNYELASGYRSDDELGYLAESFEQMAGELKQKEFLNRFLSDIARDAIAGRKTTRATRIEATVMFSDIRNFTSLSEAYPPEQIGEMLNEYMTMMETIIERNGGSIEKFIGDAIMALFLPRMGMAQPAIRAANA